MLRETAALEVPLLDQLGQVPPYKVLAMLREAKSWIGTWLAVYRWNGFRPPPHGLKQRVVKGYAERYQTSTFVETGTYHGRMTAAARTWFDEIHTIELDPVLADAVRERFTRWRGIHVYQGDSAAVLPLVLQTISGPTLFWLDAHYSGGTTARGDKDTPIARELELVLPHPLAKVILIDDAREFGAGAYPSLDHVEAMAKSAGMTMEVDLDIIRIVS